jgi:hypothetical protein
LRQPYRISRTRCLWIKNVTWWRDGKQLTEGNFTRALRSLERRGLLVRLWRGGDYRAAYRLASPETSRDLDRMATEQRLADARLLAAERQRAADAHAAYLAMCEVCGLNPETGVEW